MGQASFQKTEACGPLHACLGLSDFVLEGDTEGWISEEFWMLFPHHPPSLGSSRPKLYQRDDVVHSCVELSMSLDKLNWKTHTRTN